MTVFGIAAHNVTNVGTIRQKLTQSTGHNMDEMLINSLLLCDCVPQNDARADKLWSHFHNVD